MHIRPYELALNVELDRKGSGAANLNVPTGDLAKGMPRYSDTSGRSVAAWPRITPVVVLTWCPTSQVRGMAEHCAREIANASPMGNEV